MNRLFFFFPVLLMFFVSCAKEDMPYDIGSDKLTAKTKIGVIDTFSIKTYTVLLDSVITSINKDAQLVVGKFNDPEIGTISASGYFKLGVASVTRYTIPENAEFDSVKLYMVSSNYYTGDTTQPFTINVHRLSGNLQPDGEGYYHNNDSIPAFSELLGSLTYFPQPGSNDSVWIPLDEALGNQLFDFMKRDSSIVMDQEYFANYFKGLLVQFSPDNKAILGFKYPTNLSVGYAPAVRIYFHYNDGAIINRVYDFKGLYQQFQGEKPYHFNRFSLSNAVLSLPGVQSSKLPASQTDNQTYVMGGVGIVTRIEIPYLRNLLWLGERVQILKAELELQPVMNTYPDIPLPLELNLYTTDDKNVLGQGISNGNALQTGNLIVDELYQEETRYTFDITNFLISKLNDNTEKVPALLVYAAGYNHIKTIDRVILAGQQHSENKMKLKLYFMNIE